MNPIIASDPPTPEEEGIEEEEVSELVKVLWKEAAEHFDKLVHFVEQNNHYNGAEVINFHILQNDFYMKRGQGVRQTGIQDLMRNMSSQAEKSMDSPRASIQSILLVLLMSKKTTCIPYYVFI